MIEIKITKETAEAVIAGLESATQFGDEYYMFWRGEGDHSISDDPAKDQRMAELAMIFLYELERELEKG